MATEWLADGDHLLPVDNKELQQVVDDGSGASTNVGRS